MTAAMVTIVDQQSPWTGCTVPVVATLAHGITLGGQLGLTLGRP